MSDRHNSNAWEDNEEDVERGLPPEGAWNQPGEEPAPLLVGEARQDEEPHPEDREDPPTALVRIDILQRYLADIRRYPRLTLEEERALFTRYLQKGDNEAARQLITGNLRLVVKVALEFRRNMMNLLDLIQEGNIGLLQALKKFDPVKKVRFSTYATWWIKAYILRFILNNWSQVRFATSNERRRVFFNLNKEKRKLEERGVEPGTRLLAESMQVKEEDILDIEPMLSGGDISLDQKISEDNEQSPIDSLASSEPLPEQIVAEDEFQQLLKAKLAAFGQTLASRERIIFNKRLLAEEPARLQELANEFGVTREAIRLIEKKIIGLLKNYLQDHLKGVQEFKISLPSPPAARSR
jgi:RNA polymerase sigma-32 factor